MILQESTLRQECSKYGTVQHVKMLSEKGGTFPILKFTGLLLEMFRYCTLSIFVSAVAYVKFPSASQAAKALESLHLQTIRDGRVTVQLKVMFADPIDKLHNSETRYCLTLAKLTCAAGLRRILVRLQESQVPPRCM